MRVAVCAGYLIRFAVSHAVGYAHASRQRLGAWAYLFAVREWWKVRISVGMEKISGFRENCVHSSCVKNRLWFEALMY